MGTPNCLQYTMEDENDLSIVCCQQAASLLVGGFACFRQPSSHLQLLSLTSRCGVLVDRSDVTMHGGRTMKKFPIISSFESQRIFRKYVKETQALL
jgi:hypothetical protein